MRNNLFLGVAAVALIAPAAASAQETTSVVRGTVTVAGAPIAGATVVTTNTATGARTETTTATDGSFSQAGLAPGGPYSVEITSPQGSTTVTDINLVAQQAFDLPVELAAAGGDQGGDIVVRASSIAGAGNISGGLRTVLTATDIRKVASVNRDVRDLERRDPLATLDLSNSRAVSFAGVNPRFNRFTINGVQIGDNFGLNSDANPTGRGPVPFDGISQFSVSIAPADIRQGNFQGGAIDTVLKSGTNEFHGTGFYSESRDTMQGDRIGSNLFVKPKYNSKTYGVELDGPLIADKLFFMVAAERNTDPRALAVSSIGQVPGLTAAQVAQVQSIAQNVYNYNAGGVVSLNQQKDEKIVGRIDWNITTGQRLSLSYINAYESSTNAPNNSISNTSPSLGLASNDYQRSVLLRAGIAQLNSDWTDQFSTEARFLYKSNLVTQAPLNGLGFAQFRVCTDPTSVNATVGGVANSITNCGNNPVVVFGPDNSRQSNELFFDTWGGSIQARYNTAGHDVKILAEYNRNRTTNFFLQNSAGNYYFDSLADFQNRNAASLSYANAVSLNTRDVTSNFKYDQWTFGIQDTWSITDTLDFTYGVRYDLYGMRSAVAANNAYFSRFGFYNTQTYKGLDNFQPRLSFNWKPDTHLRVRGTAAVFGGGSPDIYLSNSYSNTGVLSNGFTINRSLALPTAANGGFTTLGCAAPFNTATGNPSGTSVCTTALNGVTGTSIPGVVNTYLSTNTGSLLTASTSSLSQNFRPPSVMKLNLSADYTLAGFTFGLDYLHTKTIQGVSFTDLRSRVVGVLPDGRPRYTFVTTPGAGTQTADNNADYLLYNDSRGVSNILVARFDKQFDWGLSFGGSYARQWVKDVSPATSSTPGSLYSNAAKADPNFPAYGTSNDETTWAFKYNLGFDHAFFGDYKTTFQLFGETRAGRRYSYTMIDTAPPGVSNCNRTCTFGTTGNNNAFLLYVPTGAADSRVVYDSVATQTALEGLITGSVLKDYRGKVAPKNIARSRAFTRIDLHVEQELPTFIGKSRLSIFGDIENLPNLINHNWGGLRQLGFPYTASVIRVQCLQAAAAATNGVENAAAANAAYSTSAATQCAQYRYSSYQAPQDQVVNTANSLYLIRVGARFSF